MAEIEALMKKIDDLNNELDQLVTEGERLRESEEIYRTIWQKSFAAIYVSQNGRLCKVNANVTEYTGYPEAELIGMKIDAMIHPDDRDSSVENAKAMLRGETATPYVYRIITKLGDIRWIMETVSCITHLGKPAILGNAMDITEHRLAVKRMWESENLYRTIFETTGTATIIVEEDTIVSLVNSEFVALSGYNKEEWEGKKSWTEFVVPRDVDRMKAYHYLRRIARRAAPRNYECDFIDSRGRIRNVVLTVDMIPGTRKSIASFADITDYKLALEKIKESGNMYRTIFETTGTATIIIEEDTTVSLVNSEFVALSGYNKEDWEGKKSWTEIIVPEDVDRMLSFHYLRRNDRQKPPRNYEFRLIDSEGRIRNVILTVDIIPGTKKSVASFADITEHKLAALRLQESENLYRTIFENTGTATIIAEEDATISLANTEFETLSGAPKQFWEGRRKWTDLISSRELPRMSSHHRLRGNNPNSCPRNYQCELTDKKGNRKTVLISSSMIAGSNKSVISFTDITEQKRSEAALRKREQEVQKKSRNLEEVNTALKVLLKQREADKQELEEKVLSNVKNLVLPYLNKLKANRLQSPDFELVNIVEKNLSGIISPFRRRLSSKYLNLTPKEIQVSYLIKEGKTTKEIAEMMTISEATVSLHRDHIRKKLGINNKKINLISYLDSLS
ncbi:MAG: hypothetical protein CSYNP_00118 [Syntrophus sp. SKADARSKE-3]|nr:hypothetical protein [Syntrophus sp. SKADARSKE-3]